MPIIKDEATIFIKKDYKKISKFIGKNVEFFNSFTYNENYEDDEYLLAIDALNEKKATIMNSMTKIIN